MTLGLQILLIFLFFLKDFKILNVKVVPNDTKNFGAEGVKTFSFQLFGKFLDGILFTP